MSVQQAIVNGYPVVIENEENFDILDQWHIFIKSPDGQERKIGQTAGEKEKAKNNAIDFATRYCFRKGLFYDHEIVLRPNPIA